MPHRVLVVAALLSVPLLGCRPGDFNSVQSDAPVKAISAPGYFERGGFGSRIAVLDGTTATGVRASRIGITGGPDSAYAVYDLWTGDDIGRFAGPLWNGCDDRGECGPLAGSSIAAIPRFAERTGCFVVPSPTDGSTRVTCESSPTESLRLRTETSIGLGTAAASMPVGHPGGLALLGAPGAAGGDGGLWIVIDEMNPVELTVPSLVLASGGAFGTELEVTGLGDGRALVLALAPGRDRVVVLTIDLDRTVSAVACLDGGVEGFGGGMGMADVDGDGELEVLVGGEPQTAASDDTVRVYDLAPFAGDAVGCADTSGADDPARTTIACPGVTADVEIPCEGSAFGAAFAVGDLDADGHDDLVVGAPEATVDGKPRAGAVWVIPGAASGLDPERSVVLHDSDPGNDNAQLGAVVRMGKSSLLAGTGPRDEPVVGAPGTDEVFIFLCSGLAGDSPADLDDPTCVVRSGAP